MADENNQIAVDRGAELMNTSLLLVSSLMRL
ncbi:hypothetical protein MCEMSEM29_00504 [Methylophilaceae bacterium]